MSGLALWQRLGATLGNWLTSSGQRPRPRRRTVLTVEQLEDRLAPAAVDFAVTQNWGSGFQANLTINNPANAAPINNWELEFNYSANITSIWDATIVSHVGTDYVIDNAGWNGSIPAGGNASFGFNASPGNTTAPPTDYLLNGAPLGSPTPPPTTPPPAATGNVAFSVQSDWGTGFTGQITVSNPGTAPLSNWSLAFTFPGQISSIWNAAISSQTGNQYVIQPASWNATIPAGGSISFGFVASPGGGAAVPTNFVLNGASTGGSGSTGGTTNQPPTAGNLSAATQPGVPVTINVLANASDPDGDTVSLLSATQGKDGTVTANSNGTVTYTPASGFSGSDTFTYTVSDGHGNDATGTVTITVAAPPVSTGSTWPSQVFAPYVDMTLYPTYNLVSAARNEGIKYFTLAFITADSNNQPAWGGYTSYEVGNTAFSSQIAQQIAGVRSLGGDVMVSFGGAAGQELAQTITNLAALTNAYEKVINTYNVTNIDFDIEGAAEANTASIDLRSQAIAQLEQNAAAQGKTLNVWFTLPVLPTGLTSDGLYVLQSALKYGVKIAGVNIMTMDYGDGAAPNPAGQMGTYAIDAAQSLFAQLRTLYGPDPTNAQLWQMVGVTPMIGMNDLTDEVFTLAAAQQLVAWAEQQGIGRISMWSLNRDQESSSGALSYVSDTSSSLVQSPFAFSSIFEPFTK